MSTRRFFGSVSGAQTSLRTTHLSQLTSNRVASQRALSSSTTSNGGRSANGAQPRVGFASAAVASTLGLSLAGAAYYAFGADPIRADTNATPGGDFPQRILDSSRSLGGTGKNRLDTVSEAERLRARKSVEIFSLDAVKDVDEVLRRYEESHFPSVVSTGIGRYDIAQIASNDPIEDDHAEAIVTDESGNSCWSFFGVYDGHLGWETSAMLREQLIGMVSEQFHEIGGTASDSADSSSSSSDPYAEAMKRAFKRMDDKVVHDTLEQVLQSKSRTLGIDLLAPAYAGACGLVAAYDAKSSVLRVALTGDCRAILGRKRADGKYDVEELTTDQNCHDPAEKARVEAAHPGENVVSQDRRTMGFAPSRVFGDARLKWSRETLMTLKEKYLGRSVPDSIKTPPYMIAEPVVTVTNVNPGDFVVLATDGLFECLTDREVVGLVGRWVQQRRGQGSSWWNVWSGARKGKDELPVVGGSLTNEFCDRYQQWKAEKKFITVDANAATHLIRNALGGAHEDLQKALLSMRSPRARSYWDDITATVIFFGET